MCFIYNVNINFAINHCFYSIDKPFTTANIMATMAILNSSALPASWPVKGSLTLNSSALPASWPVKGSLTLNSSAIPGSWPVKESLTSGKVMFTRNSLYHNNYFENYVYKCVMSSTHSHVTFASCAKVFRQFVAIS